MPTPLKEKLALLFSRHAALYWILGALAAALAVTGDASTDQTFGGNWRFADRVVLIPGIDPYAGRFDGSSLYFNDDFVEAPSPFGCELASYEVLTVPWPGLFQGHFEEAEPRSIDARFVFPVETETLRVNCSTGSFDYHVVGDRMYTMLDGVVHILERRGN